MHLKHLSLTNYRSFARLDIEIPRRVILLTGDNAQGKTTFLEAIYFLAAFTSFQTHADRQIVNLVASKETLAVTRLVADYVRGTGNHRLEIRLILEPVGPLNGQRLRKEMLLDGVKHPPADIIGHFNAVVFVPQMTQIIEGGPEERRRYLNLALAQSVPGYARLLGEYTQAVTQRNALLKMLNERNGDSSQLDFWDETISRSGASIIRARITAVDELEALARNIHSALVKGKESLRLIYQPSFDPLPDPQGQFSLQLDTDIDRSALTEEEISRGFLDRLRQIRNEEISRGVTTIGPHRDELRFVSNAIDVGDLGSRGQIRTILLALKLAEVERLKKKTGQHPVLLLDEVLAELDPKRRSDLLSYLDNMEQALITTTDMELFNPSFLTKIDLWKVKDGSIQVFQKGEK